MEWTYIQMKITTIYSKQFYYFCIFYYKYSNIREPIPRFQSSIIIFATKFFASIFSRIL